MKNCLLGSASAIVAVALAATPALAIKKGPYPEVKVELADAYTPEPELAAMLKALNAAIAKKDTAALFALVGPTFVWTFEGGPNQVFDPGGNSLHNFKVAFGFRAPGKSQDGGVDDGPYWDGLAELAAETRFYQPPNTTNLVCGPIAAEPVDQDIFEKANKQIETPDEAAEWYFTFGDTPVAKAPGDTGAPVAKLTGTVALPVVSSHPPAPAQGPAPPTTHVEVLLTSGRTGWVPVTVVSPLVNDRLCFSKTAGGWKISTVDQNRN